MRKILILDLDGTLFDISIRSEKCQKISKNRKEFWNCFQSNAFMDLDTPKVNIINYARSLIDENTIIIILSGRSQKQLERTLEQLNNINLTPHEIYLRGERDFRKDYEFKADIISQLINKYNDNIKEIIMIDDSDDVLNYVSVKFPNIKLVDAKTL